MRFRALTGQGCEGDTSRVPVKNSAGRHGKFCRPFNQRDRNPIYAAFLRGTFAPFFLASESPIAMACLRLFTVPPLPPRPDFSVPYLRRRMALATVFCAPFPYLRRDDFFFLGMQYLLKLRGPIGELRLWINSGFSGLCLGSCAAFMQQRRDFLKIAHERCALLVALRRVGSSQDRGRMRRSHYVWGEIGCN